MTTENGRLDKLEDHAIRTEGRLNAIEGTQTDHTRKLDNIGLTLDSIRTAITRYDSRPVFDFHSWVKTVGVLFTICAVLGGLATWFVLTMTAADKRVTEVRLDYQAKEIAKLWSRTGWQPTIEGKGQ